MARFGTKKYSHTYQDLVVSHKGDNRIHLSPGENGTSAVAVVGIGGYKNEEQLRTGNHWAKIYSSECLPGDEVCEVAPTSAEFGALICDFNDFKPDAEAECWTVTTVGKNATIREKRRSYRNPVDRFFLVAGERPGGSKEGRTEVFINEATANDVANKSRGLGGRERRNANRRSLKRSNCTDVQPPPSGGVSYSCAQQKEWGKCDSWFMKNGRLCDRTCGRCVDIFEDFTDDYEDYLEVETAPAEAPTSSAGDSLEDEMDVELIKKKRGVEEETDDDDATTAPAPAPAPSSASDGDGVTDEEEIILGADAAPAPSPTADENDELMLRVDFDGVADDVLAGGAEDTRGTLQPSRRRAVAPSPAARGTRGTRGGV